MKAGYCAFKVISLPCLLSVKFLIALKMHIYFFVGKEGQVLLSFISS